MTYEMMYSLRMALEYGLPEVNDVQMIYEGVSLTDIPKPFVTIEYLMGAGELLSAGRRSYEETYDYQIGIFARNVNELFQLESKVRKLLREPYGHPLFAFDDETGTFMETGEKFLTNENGFTPIKNDDISDTTGSHRGYFDVSIEHFSTR